MTTMRLLFCLLPVLLPAFAAPTSPASDLSDQLNILKVNDGPTADDSAGLGFEFESPFFYFKSDGCSVDDTNAAKKQMVAGRQGNNWILTADTGVDAWRLNAEYIVDGRKVKVGRNIAQAVGREIVDDLRKWSPWKGRQGGKQVYLNIANNKCNPWYISSPMAGDKADNVPWDPQVTAPMPLEAVYDLMLLQRAALDENTASSNPLTGSQIRYPYDFILVTKEYFQHKPNGISEDMATEDVLAFLSLVLTYAKGANLKMRADESPKFLSSFMPRSDFTVLYKQVEKKLKGDLWDLVNTLACYKRRTQHHGTEVSESSLPIDHEFCSGTPEKPNPSAKLSKLYFENVNAKNAAEMKMSIKDWIKNMKTKDMLRVFDAGIDGSVGGLGSRMETLYNSNRKVPIFEFRDIPDKMTSQIEQYMVAADNEVQRLHNKYKKAPAS